jgi:hypothetical protein
MPRQPQAERQSVVVKASSLAASTDGIALAERGKPPRQQQQRAQALQLRAVWTL